MREGLPFCAGIFSLTLHAFPDACAPKTSAFSCFARVLAAFAQLFEKAGVALKFVAAMSAIIINFFMRVL